MRCVVRKMLVFPIRIRAHVMERKRLNRLGVSGIRIGIFGPPVHKQQELPFPSGRERRKTSRRIVEDHLVA
jgi:hypothetical protein